MSRASSLNLMKILKKEVVRSVDMMAFDVMDQLSVEIFAFFNIILCKIRNSNIYMAGVLIIFFTDCTQIQTIGGHPLLTSFHIISFLKTVTL